MEHTHLVKGLDYALLQKVRYCFILSVSITETIESNNILHFIHIHSSRLEFPKERLAMSVWIFAVVSGQINASLAYRAFG